MCDKKISHLKCLFFILSVVKNVLVYSDSTFIIIFSIWLFYKKSAKLSSNIPNCYRLENFGNMLKSYEYQTYFNQILCMTFYLIILPNTNDIYTYIFRDIILYIYTILHNPVSLRSKAFLQEECIIAEPFSLSFPFTN